MPVLADLTDALIALIPEDGSRIRSGRRWSRRRVSR
jgi:hypothetical protein